MKEAKIRLVIHCAEQFAYIIKMLNLYAKTGFYWQFALAIYYKNYLTMVLKKSITLVNQMN